MTNGLIFLGFAFAIAAIIGIAFNIRDAILDSTERMKDPLYQVRMRNSADE